MNINVTIKELGKIKGTCKWVKEEIENNNLEFVEATRKSNNMPCLIMKYGGEKKVMIARFNTGFDVCSEQNSYERLDLADYDYDCCDDTVDFRGYTYLGFTLTPTAKKIIYKIANEWCSKKNYDYNHDNDNEYQINIAITKREE